MIINGHWASTLGKSYKSSGSLSSGPSHMTCRTTMVKSCSHDLVSPYIARNPANVAQNCIAYSMEHGHMLKLGFSKGIPDLSSLPMSSPFLGGSGSSLSRAVPKLSKRSRSFQPPRASMDIPGRFKAAPMKTKPKWWWRTLACLPYLMPLHETWMFAETAYHLHSFLEVLEYWSRPFFRALGQLPPYSLILYFLIAYIFIVRNKFWPHFVRFHVANGLLLEISLQIVGYVTRWVPRGVYWGKYGMHFWTAYAFAHLFTVLECIRFALRGMYADVPFLSDAAYMQIPHG